MSSTFPSLCNESVFTEVFKNYSETLFNYLFFKSGNETLARDLTQDAFMTLWKKCAEVSFPTAKGFVFTTAKNRMLNEFAHQKVKFKFQDTIKERVDKEDPSFILEQKQLKKRLEEAIASLPEKQRVAFMMSRFEKKTYKAIALDLGISKQAVEKRIYKALDTLRKISEKIK